MKLTRMAFCMAAAAAAFAQSPGRDPGSPEALARIAAKVRKELVMLTDYGVFDFVSFQVSPASRGYQVTLHGYASRPALKSSAERVVKRVEEVETVKNEIEELPLSRQDEDLRLRVYAKIYLGGPLTRYNPNRGAPLYGSPRSFGRAVQMGISNDPPPGVHPISIIARNGKIFLEGVVDNQGDKDLAGLYASSVPGSFGVTNNLVVLSPSKSKQK